MAKGLVGFNCALPNGLTTMYVNDVVRDAMNGGVLPSGHAANVQELISVLDDFFGDAFWFVQPIGVNNNPAMLAGVQPVFPNAYSNSSPVNYSVNGVDLLAQVGDLSSLNGWGDGVIPPGTSMASSYTILGHSVIARYAYEVRVCFPVFRSSEIDFENRTVNITDDTPTLNEICWIEIAWRTNTFDYAVEVTPASESAHLRNIYERARALGTAPYTNYIGSTDPYNPGGESEPGGGTGNFDGTGDDIGIPGLPSLSAVDTGFITLFNPSIGELRSLANYMWSSGFDLDTFKKIFADPMDCILGLSIVPVSVPGGGAATVSIGNISTGISMTKAASQYVEVDCGTLNVNEYWGAYLDYDPYTKAEIYLPYIGTHPIAVDDIMDKSVTVKYNVDILSGACTAFVQCDGSVLYEFIGQCSSSIPISGNDWTNVINGVLTVAGAIGSMVATGGASAPMSAGVIASTAVNSMKPNVEKSGSMSGTGGMLAIQTPYLILTRPRQALPANQNQYTGYPSFITRQLSDISGYTEIESIHIEGIPATKQELSEIENLLKGGVIL